MHAFLLKNISFLLIHIFVVKCSHALKCCSTVQFFPLSKLGNFILLKVATRLTKFFSMTSMQTKNTDLTAPIKFDRVEFNSSDSI